MTRASIAINGATLSIAGVLDFESVLDIDAHGQQWLVSVAPAQCEVDLAAVTYSSSVGIALLLGWMRAAQKVAKSVVIKNIPADMLALASVSGLDAVLTASHA
ncbi:MAG: STAS domain-containing protein [Spongiibacteraceae bacterium]